MINFREELEIINKEMEEVIRILEDNEIKYKKFCANVLTIWITPEYKEIETNLFFDVGEVHYYEEHDKNHDNPIVKDFEEFKLDLLEFLEN